MKQLNCRIVPKEEENGIIEGGEPKSTYALRREYERLHRNVRKAYRLRREAWIAAIYNHMKYESGTWLGQYGNKATNET